MAHKLYTENELSRISGRSRDWILARLADVPRKDGKLSSDSVIRALCRSGAPGSLVEAKRAECEARTTKLRIETEVLQRQRIPIEVVSDTLESVFGEIKSVIDRSALSEKEKSQVREELTSIPERLKW